MLLLLRSQSRAVRCAGSARSRGRAGAPGGRRQGHATGTTVVITGATGSGKSCALFNALQALRRDRRAVRPPPLSLRGDCDHAGSLLTGPPRHPGLVDRRSRAIVRTLQHRSTCSTCRSRARPCPSTAGGWTGAAVSWTARWCGWWTRKYGRVLQALSRRNLDAEVTIRRCLSRLDRLQRRPAD